MIVYFSMDSKLLQDRLDLPPTWYKCLVFSHYVAKEKGKKKKDGRRIDGLKKIEEGGMKRERKEQEKGE